MVGFAIIIIIVAVLILVFVAISLNNNSSDFLESSKTDSFIQAILQYTSTCEINGNNLDYLDLIESCSDMRLCDNGVSPCLTLNSTSSFLLDKGWRVGENLPIKGYNYEIKSENRTILSLSKGNVTGLSKGSRQTFSEGIQISLVSYH